MGPVALEAYRLGDARIQSVLAQAMHIAVDDRVWGICFDLARQLPGDAPIQGDLPAPTTFLEIDGRGYIFIAEGEEVFIWAVKNGSCVSVGSFYRRSLAYRPNRDVLERLGDKADEMVSALLFRSDLLFSLMAEPRLVEQRPVARQRRRAAERVLGKDAPAVWKEIRWTIGEKTCPKVADGDENHRMPLHFSRAHWAYVGHQTEKSEKRHGPRGLDYYTWRKHSWKGHPAFGVSLHTYTPIIDADGVSATTIGAVKAQATLAAKNAAIAAWQQERAG